MNDKKYKQLKKYILILAAMVFILTVANAVLIIKLLSIGNERKEDSKEAYNGSESVVNTAEGTGDQDTGENTADDAGTEGTDTEMTSEDDTASDTAEANTGDDTLTGVDKKVEDKLSEMSLRDKVCQMFLVTPEGLTGYSQCTYAGDATKESIEKYPVSGVIYFADNLESVSQTEEMIANTKKFAMDNNGIPLFVAVDEEGGTVARCAYKLGTTNLDDMYYYREQGVSKAYDNAYTIASDIKGLGFNLDFAPVADTWSNSANTVIGTRAYSDDFEETAELVASAVKGFNDGGVVCTLKHFPGHGDTAEDSHSGSAYASKTLDQLQKEEFLSFKAGIDAGADMVMVGHITMTGVDGLPAVFSHTLVTEQLREELGFEGVIVTDALNMGAISNIYGSDEAAVKCIEAGIDLLLMPNDLETAVNGVVSAVESGEISEDRIDESVRRILKLKFEKCDQ